MKSILITSIVFVLISHIVLVAKCQLFDNNAAKKPKPANTDALLKNTRTEHIETREERYEKSSDGSETREFSETKETRNSRDKNRDGGGGGGGGGGGALGALGLGGALGGGGGGPAPDLNNLDLENIDLSQSVISTLFSSYTQQYGKKYSKKEKKERMHIFKNNMEQVKTHNKKNRKYKKGVNEFTDMNYEEVEKEHTGYKETQEKDENGDVIMRSSEPVPDPPNMPASWDWRDHGILTTARNQGKCGSCWSFAAACCLESHNMKRQIAEGKFDKNRQIFVSEQNLIDCSAEKFGSQGCDGGMPQQAWRYVAANGGINVLSSYPYTAKKEECNYRPEHKADVVVLDAKRLKTGIDEDLAKAIYNYGPIAVAVHVTRDMAMYKAGVFDDPTCNPKKVNHAVVAVGYSPDYFVIRNSWGDKWGENGYIKIARTAAGNNCGVSQQGYYPILPNAVDTADMRSKFH